MPDEKLILECYKKGPDIHMKNFFSFHMNSIGSIYDGRVNDYGINGENIQFSSDCDDNNKSNNENYVDKDNNVGYSSDCILSYLSPNYDFMKQNTNAVQTSNTDILIDNDSKGKREGIDPLLNNMVELHSAISRTNLNDNDIKREDEHTEDHDKITENEIKSTGNNVDEYNRIVISGGLEYHMTQTVGDAVTSNGGMGLWYPLLVTDCTRQGMYTIVYVYAYM